MPLAAIASRPRRGKVGIDQQLRAIQLLLAYAYGPPKAEIALEHSGSVAGTDLARLHTVIVEALEPFPEAMPLALQRLEKH